MELILKRFGSYFLLDRIAVGGMAEIFRARPARPEANGQVLVLKRILEEVSQQGQFRQMFSQETAVCMGFSHSNTIRISDFGEVGGTPYLAMEYVEGKTIAQIVTQARAQGGLVPVAMALPMILQAAAGLHYAHSFRSLVTGEPLKVIHRDISPQNILVSYQGVVKLIDFGIAKSEITIGEKTAVGVVKGKASYFSPEQAGGGDLDWRTDIFSLGIVLWELLAGRKLFSAQDHNTLKLLETIRECEKVIVPPSTYNPEVPPDLDVVVLQALNKDKTQRYQTAEEFQRAIKGVLARHLVSMSNTEISDTMRLLFGHEIDFERENLRELNRQAQEKIVSEGEGADQVTAVLRAPPGFTRKTSRLRQHAGWAGALALLLVGTALTVVATSRYLPSQSSRAQAEEIREPEAAPSALPARQPAESGARAKKKAVRKQ